MGTPLVTAAELRSRFDYDPASGVFTHTRDFGTRFKVGDRADRPAHGALSGYQVLCLLGRKFLAHRMAWLYVHCELPAGVIDHINGDRSDNRLANLRPLDIQSNVQNQRRASKNSRTGVLGVFPHQGKFRVRLTVDRKSVHVGVYESIDEASAAYVQAKRNLHPGCTL